MQWKCCRWCANFANKNILKRFQKIVLLIFLQKKLYFSKMRYNFIVFHFLINFSAKIRRLHWIRKTFLFSVFDGFTHFGTSWSRYNCFWKTYMCGCLSVCDKNFVTKFSWPCLLPDEFVQTLRLTSGQAILLSKLIDGRYQVQSPVTLVDLPFRSFPWKLP